MSLGASLRNLLARCTVRLVESSGKQQRLQVGLLAGETKSDIEHMEAYGLTSNPHPGAQGVAAFFDGDRSHGVVLCVGDRRYRLAGLEPGEVALYDDQGQKVHLTRDGIDIITSKRTRVMCEDFELLASKKIRLQCEDFELHASKSWSWDVYGYGQRITWTSGVSYEIKSWQTGAIVTPVSLPINQPEGP